MAAVSCSASFKKKDGTLVLSKQGLLTWTPAAGAQPDVSLTTSSITNLQQTPPDKPKVMLKVFAGPENVYLFTFTSPQARAEADGLRDALSTAIQAAKAGVPSTKPSSSSSEVWYDDDKLRSDVDLQQSLLKANPSLSRTFMEAMKNKPESILTSQFSYQFWSTRLNQLRAYAIERNQSKGSYNVLSTIKSRTEDNVSTLNITREQINLIFSQHPLVRRVYDECVPKLSEEQFWARFFQSRLLKKLKGEKITEADSKDNVLDRYLSFDDDLERAQRNMAAHVPHIIDLVGNDVHHSQRQGNAPDLLMRPTRLDRVPIIRTLNSLSEKILSQVTPNDVDPSAPIGVDEETFNSLALRDLAGDAEENRVPLNIRDQSRFFGHADEEDTTGISGFKFSTPDHTAAIRTISPQVQSITSGLDLSTAIGFDPDSSESESEADPPPPSTHYGSHLALRQASRQVFTAIAQQRAQAQDGSPDTMTSSTPLSTSTSTATNYLPQALFDRVLLTHATATEFLQYFWSAYSSGNASRADDIARYVETLDHTIDRIKAVAKDAEVERGKEIARQRQYVREYYERSKKKLPFDQSRIWGGEKAVNELMAPTVAAIGKAVADYRLAVREAGEGVA